jgi:hypothetical protein
VSVNNPPASGDYAGNASYVETIISQGQPSLFSFAMGMRGLLVSARAVGGNSPVTAGPYIVVLDSSAKDALLVGGGGAIGANGCGIGVNSTNSSSALNLSGGSTLTASSIKVVGGYTVCSTCSSTPTPTAHAAATDDPFANIAPPTVSATCDHNGASYSGTVTLNPGVYCGGIAIGSGANATFN